MGKEQHSLTSLVNMRKPSVAREQSSLESLLKTFAIVHTEKDLGRLRNQTRIWGFIIALVPSLPTVLTSLSDMPNHLQTHNWWLLSGDLLSFLAGVCLFFVLIAAVTKIQRSPLPGDLLELRQRLNDEALIPPGTEHPLRFEAKEISLKRTRIGPIRRVKGFVILCTGIGIFFLLITILFTTLVATLLPWLQGPDAATNFWAAIALSILLLCCLAFAIMLFILALRMTRARKVTVDERGLRWAWPNLIKGRSVALAWHEITGFYEVTGPENRNDAAKTYVLDSDTSTFIWSLKQDSTEEELQASDRLARLIVTRTDLPLRDLTRAIESLLSPSSKTKEITITEPGMI